MPLTTSRISGSATTGLIIESPLGLGNVQTITTNASTAEKYNYVFYGPIKIDFGSSLNIAMDTNVKIIDIDEP